MYVFSSVVYTNFTWGCLDFSLYCKQNLKSLDDLSTIMYFFISNLGRGGRKGAVEKCSTCRGTGMQVHVRQLGPGMVQQIQSVCSECRGQGERISAKDRCKTCAGAKTVRERKILEVHVDKGELRIESSQGWVATRI